MLLLFMCMLIMLCLQEMDQDSMLQTARRLRAIDDALGEAASARKALFAMRKALLAGVAVFEETPNQLLDVIRQQSRDEDAMRLIAPVNE